MSKISAPTWLTSERTVRLADRWSGPALSAVGHVIEGNQAAADAKFVAKQLKQQSKAAMATATFQANDLRRQKTLLESRARAVAASGGGSASDVNVVDAISSIAREGESRALQALYNGREASKGLSLQAAGANASGRNMRLAKHFRAATTLFAPGFGRYRSLDELLKERG